MASAVALIGGGIKGAVAAARAAHKNELVLLHVNYGQASALAEVNAAHALLNSFGAARLVAVDLAHLQQFEEQLAGTPQTAFAAPSDAGFHTDAPAPAALLGLMPLLVSVGAQCAMRVGASRVTLGLSRMADATHLGLPLSEGQPARRHGLVHASNLLMDSISSQREPLRIEAPLLDTSYAEAINLAFHFHLPVDALWTCTASGRKPCRRCQRCTDRANAFVEARRVDPLLKPTPTQTVAHNGERAGSPA